jgi:glycosyltransferase involved in cell wall biosynthesis
MAHGAPVVSSDATCLPEIYGDAAYYFDPNDTEAMANAIGDVLDKSNLRGRLIAAGKEQVKTYSWRRMAEQTLAVYRQVLGEK